MKKRFIYTVVIFMLLFLAFGTVNCFMDARDKKLEEERREKDKIAKTSYVVNRDNNTYTVKSDKLKDKKLGGIHYDSYNVFLYYYNDNGATLLKYNIKDDIVVVLFEDDVNILGDFKVIGEYFKLGNSIYDNKFNKVMDYKDIDSINYLDPNMEKYLDNNDGVVLKSIKECNIEDVVKNREEFTYNPIMINDKYILVSEDYNDEFNIILYNKKLEEVSTFEKMKKEAKYKLIDDYLLEKYKNDNDKMIYKIYNINNKENIYKSSSKDDNYLFSNTKIIYNDLDNNIKLVDYKTKEEKILIKSSDNIDEYSVNNFILSKDKFSLVITLNNSDKVFYIYYL